jgi:hypothetical protein
MRMAGLPAAMMPWTLLGTISLSSSGRSSPEAGSGGGLDNHARLMHAVPIGVRTGFGFDAGHVRRAPMGMRFNGLEWLYRLASLAASAVAPQRAVCAAFGVRSLIEQVGMARPS